jgi:hypothetical protein
MEVASLAGPQTLPITTRMCSGTGPNLGRSNDLSLRLRFVIMALDLHDHHQIVKPMLAPATQPGHVPIPEAGTNGSSIQNRN